MRDLLGAMTPLRRGRALLIAFACALLVLAVTEGIVIRFLAVRIPRTPVASSASGVQITMLDPLAESYENVPPPDRPTMVMIGDSHLNVSASEWGAELVAPFGHTVIDELANHLAEADPSRRSWTFLRFSTGALTPPAMLGSIGRLLEYGVRPWIVVIAARPGSFLSPAASLRQTDPDLVTWLLPVLQMPEVGASDIVLRSYRAALTDPSRTARADRAVLAWLQPRFTLLAMAAGVRFLFASYRWVAWQTLFPHAMQHSPRPEAAEEAFASFETLLRLLRSRGVQTFCYVPPERPSSMPPSTVPARAAMSAQAKQRLADELRRRPVAELTSRLARRNAVARIQTIAAENDCPFVDATDLIPDGDTYWGWWRYEYDRTHFRQPGHLLLGTFLFTEGERRHVWDQTAARRGRDDDPQRAP